MFLDQKSHSWQKTTGSYSEQAIFSQYSHVLFTTSEVPNLCSAETQGLRVHLAGAPRPLQENKINKNWMKLKNKKQKVESK